MLKWHTECDRGIVRHKRSIFSQRLFLFIFSGIVSCQSSVNCWICFCSCSAFISVFFCQNLFQPGNVIGACFWEPWGMEIYLISYIFYHTSFIILYCEVGRGFFVARRPDRRSREDGGGENWRSALPLKKRCYWCYAIKNDALPLKTMLLYIKMMLYHLKDDLIICLAASVVPPWWKVFLRKIIVWNINYGIMISKIYIINHGIVI